MSKLGSIVLLMLALAGCPGFGDEAPPATVVEKPTWTVDILPVYNKYCNSCHGVPATQGAPGFFRLDKCEDGDVLGAQSINDRNLIRMRNIAAPMPPTSFGLVVPDALIVTVENWQNNGAPCSGTGGPTNNMNNTNNTTNNATNNATNNTTNNGTNNTTNNGTNGTVSFVTQVAPILSGSCGTSPCHGRPGGQGGLAIPFGATPEQVRMAIDGVPTSDGLDLIAPNNPASSEIYLRMSSDFPDRQMPPPPAARLSVDKVDVLRIWIEEGAVY